MVAYPPAPRPANRGEHRPARGELITGLGVFDRACLNPAPGLGKSLTFLPRVRTANRGSRPLAWRTGPGRAY
jgi:hypothetical protein